MSARVAFVLKGYPRLSETFIAQEIAALEARGLDLMIVSLRHPTDRKIHALNRQIRAGVVYLPEYLYQEPWRLLKAWWRVRRWAGYQACWRLWWQDLRRDLTPNRGRRFGQALVLAAELPASVNHLHAHFIHTPGSVARYAAILRGLPLSLSAHAKDIWTSPDWEKAEKLADARWVVTCTASNRHHLAALADQPGKVELVYHGLDFSRFPRPERAAATRDGSDPAAPVVIISVGRAVAKKGYDDLLIALSRLPADLHWRFVHIGGGGLIETLKAQAQALGLAQRITWRGSCHQEEVIAALAKADLFVLASKIADDGDRDGLPNVLMEAQCQALPCLATAVSAIPELIIADQTGWLVPPAAPDALAAALAAMIRDPGLRDRLGQAGYQRVHQHFSMARGIDHLADKFGLAPPP